MINTLPETNIAPENRPSKRKLVFQPSIFRGYVSCREGKRSISSPFRFLLSTKRRFCRPPRGLLPRIGPRLLLRCRCHQRSRPQHLFRVAKFGRTTWEVKNLVNKLPINWCRVSEPSTVSFISIKYVHVKYIQLMTAYRNWNVCQTNATFQKELYCWHTIFQTKICWNCRRSNWRN